MFAIFENWELMEFLVYLILFITVLIGVFLLFVLTSHFSKWRWEKSFSRKKDAWEGVLYSYLYDEISIERAVNDLKGHHLILWEFLKPYLTYLKGEERDKIIALARMSGLTNYFFKKLREGKKNEKITAASALGKLGEKQMVTYLKEMLFSDDTVEMIFAAKAIADLKETSYLIPVFRRLLNDTYTTFEGISEVAVRFGEGICVPITNIIQEWLDGKRDLADTFKVPEEQVLSLLVDILGYYRHVNAAPQFEKVLMKVSDNEVVIHIFKALSRLEYPTSIALEPFLFHRDWIIRSQALKYIGKLQDRVYVEEVKVLLKDESWWVRYYAAQALYLMGEIPYLKQVSALNDRSAEMSQYILDKNQAG